MKAMIRQVVRASWDLVLAIAAAIAAALWLAPTTLDHLTTEIIAFFTIQSAVILPAMIFTAGILRGDGLSVSELERYQGALRCQMQFWITLLFLDFLSVAVVILAKAASWKWKITVLHSTYDLAWLIIGLTVFFSALAVLRMIPFVKGVMSLLELNGLMARKVAEARGKEAVTGSPDPISPFKPPEGFGRIIPPSRRRHRS